MATEIARLLNTLKLYLFNKTSIVISISVTNLLVNVIFSEVCSKKYSKDFHEPPLTNLSMHYEYNMTCYTDYKHENDSKYDNMLLVDVLSRKSLTCLRYWKYRFCSSSTNSTSNCFPISKKPNFNLNDFYSGTFSEPKSKTQSTIMFIYLLQTVQVCLEAYQITIKEISVCSIQRFKDHMFRVIPIIIHSASFVELVRTPELRFAYGNSILFYVSCLLAKSAFNVIVVLRVFMDYSPVCNIIGLALHLSWLLSQTWQIVISYQIWKCFRSGLPNVRPRRTRPVLGDSINDYPIAWILPIMIVLFTLSMDLLPGVPDSMRPEFGVCQCWFVDVRTRMIYAAVPAAFAEIVALAMFLATLHHLSAARSLSRSLQRSDSRRHCPRETQWIMIYLKVSFLTGASYILVTLLALYTLNYKVPQGVPSYIINTVKDIERLRGFEIFYIFVLNKRHFLKAPTSSYNEQNARTVEYVSMVELRVASN